MDRIRELSKEIRLKHLIIDHFIPHQEQIKVEKRAEWNNEQNCWALPNVEFTGNNIKKNKAAQKKGQNVGDDGNNFLYEHILNLEDDSEEEDYQNAATKRV